jgi:predicted transcriptional regulator
MGKLTARDVMNPELKTVRADLTVGELAAFFAENQITGAPVVDRDNRMVGVVSLMDLAENEASRAVGAGRGDPAESLHGWEGKLARRELRELRIVEDASVAADIMTPAVYTVPADTPIDSVARTMVAGRVHRLLVTDHERIVGIVTTMDLLKLLCGEASPAASRDTGPGC